MIESSRSRVLSENDVQISAAPVRVGGIPLPPRESKAECEASVREVRDDANRLSEIHVQCSCGESTVVICEYTE